MKKTIAIVLLLAWSLMIMEPAVFACDDPPPPTPDPDYPTCTNNNTWTNTNTLTSAPVLTNINNPTTTITNDISNNSNAEANLTNNIKISNDNESESTSNVNFNYKYVEKQNLPNIISPPPPCGILPIPGEMVGDFTVSTILPVFGGIWDSKKIKYSGKTKGVDLFIKEVFTHSETAVKVIPWFDLSTLPKELANYKGLIYGGETRKYISERKIDKYAPMYVVSDGVKEVIEGIHPNLLLVAIADEDIIKSKSFYIGAAIGGSGIPSKEAGVSATIGGGYTSSTGKTIVRPGAAVFGFHYDYYDESLPPTYTYEAPPKRHTSEGK